MPRRIGHQTCATAVPLPSPSRHTVATSTRILLITSRNCTAVSARYISDSFTHPWVFHSRVAVAVLVPRVRHRFGHILRIVRMPPCSNHGENNPARQKRIRRVIDTASRIIATSQEMPTPSPTSTTRDRTGDGQHVRHIHLLQTLAPVSLTAAATKYVPDDHRSGSFGSITSYAPTR